MYRFIIFCFFIASEVIAADPTVLYLTWQQDPTTTMTVSWLTPLADHKDLLEYKSNDQTTWLQSSGSHTPFPHGRKYMLHRCELTALQPGTTYQFRLGKEGEIHRFKTLPTDSRDTIEQMQNVVGLSKDLEVKNQAFSVTLSGANERVAQPEGNRFSDAEVAQFEAQRSEVKAAADDLINGLTNTPGFMGRSLRWACVAILNNSLKAYDMLKFSAYEDREAGIKFNTLGYKQGVEIGRLEKAAYDIEAEKYNTLAVISAVQIGVALIGGVSQVAGAVGGAACEMSGHLVQAKAARETGEVKQAEEYARALQTAFGHAGDAARASAEAEKKLMESILQGIEKLTRQLAEKFSIAAR
jgi:hypothetical protein